MRRGLVMFSVALVDDDENIHSIVRKILNDAFKGTKFTLKSYYSAQEFLDEYSSRSFSFILMDIEMPEINGVALSQRLQLLNYKTPIIFLTSFDQYMKDAFGLNVHSYILKEDMIEILPSVIKKLLLTLEIMENRKQVTFNTNKGKISLYEDDIVCILFEDRRPTIYTRKIKIMIYGEALYTVHEKLSSDMFLQPNSGIIVNLKYVKSVEDMVLNLRYFPTPITISRSKGKAVKRRYMELLASGDSL